MSAPQPPNQPWQGGQPQQWQGEQNPEQQGQPPYGQHQGPPSGPFPQQPSPPYGVPEQNPALSSPGPTEVLGGPGRHSGPDGNERTQVVRPGQQGDSTQMMPPTQPPPYGQPGMSDYPQSPPGGFPAPGGYGGPPPGGGYGPPPGGFGQPPQQGFGQPGGFPGQQPPPGYGPPPGGFAQQGGLGRPPSFGGPGANTQMIAMGIAAVVAVCGLIAAIMALTDFGDLSDYSSLVDGVPAGVADDLPSPGMMWLCTIAILLGGLAAIGGGVLLYLKHKLASIVTLAGGGVMVLFAIVYFIVLSGLPDGPSLPVWGLILGLLVAAAGALGFIPQTKHLLGGGSALGTPGGGGYGPPPGGGFGGGQAGGFGPPQQGFSPPPPPPGYGPPPPQGGYGPPPPQGGGYGQPGPPPPQW